MGRRSYDLVLVQEPYSFRQKIACVGKYNQVFYSAQKDRPRTCIYTNLNCWNVGEFSSEDITTVAIPVDSKRTIYVTSLYLDIEKPVENNVFRLLVEKCAEEKIPLIVGIDTNAHGSLWGCDDTNRRGEDLELFLLQNQLYISNVGNVPTFDNDRSNSIIDITVHNRWAVDLVSDWHVNEGESLSDHKYLEYKITEYQPFFKKMRNFRKVDWVEFASILDKHSYDLSKYGNLDQAADDLNAHIREGLDVVCPLRKTLYRRPCRWWSAEIENLRNQLIEASKVRKNNIFNQIIYKKLRAKLKRAIIEAKRASWQNFVSDSQSVKDVAGLIKILEGNKAGTKTIAMMKDDGVYCSTPTESLQVLLRTHFPNHLPGVAAPVEVDDQEDVDEVVEYIDANKVKAAYDSFGPYKAAGADGFKPIVLQKLPEKVQQFIADMYRKVISKGQTPLAWKKMTVVFIPKVGKGDYSQPKAYRPITLSNFVLKGLERIVQWYVLEKNITRPLAYQHAYTKGLSTETALSNFLNNVESMVHRGRSTLAVSLDCSGAFDRIKFEPAALAMKRFEIPNNIIRWYDGVLKTRRVTANVQGCSLTITPTQGSPQGGVLSPLVWNLIMDTLLSTFNKNDPVKVLGYADDLLLYVNGTDPNTMKQLMQKALSKVQVWGQEKGLYFNPDKTTVVMFERSRRKAHEPKLLLGDTVLKYSGELKYLGMTITKRLTWTPHVKHKIKQCGYLLHKTRSVVGRDWGLSPDKMLWVYTAIIRPRIMYGSLIWAHNINSTLEQKLDLIQRRSLVAVTRCLKSTPTRALEILIGIPPLNLFLREQAIIARFRTKQLCDPDKWDGVGDVAKKLQRMGHRAIWDNELKAIPETEWPVDEINPIKNWTINSPSNTTEVSVYTDGSKINDCTGAGWAITKNNAVVAEGVEYLGDSSVFRAELTAIQCGLLWVKENLEKLKNSCSSITIYSDSKSGIQSIFAPYIKSQLVLDVALLLQTVKQTIDVSIQWVKGHDDNTGNELADMLAKKGTEQKGASVAPFLPVPRNEIKKAIKKRTDKLWQNKWAATEGCRISKKLLPTVARTNSKTIPKLGFKMVSDLAQITTGHGFFAAHMWYWDGEVDPTCKLCGEGEESSLHIWQSCKAVEHLRKDEINISNIINLFRQGVIGEVIKTNKAWWVRKTSTNPISATGAPTTS